MKGKIKKIRNLLITEVFSPSTTHNDLRSVVIDAHLAVEFRLNSLIIDKLHRDAFPEKVPYDSSILSSWEDFLLNMLDYLDKISFRDKFEIAYKQKVINKSLRNKIEKLNTWRNAFAHNVRKRNVMYISTEKQNTILDTIINILETMPENISRIDELNEYWMEKHAGTLENCKSE